MQNNSPLVPAWGPHRRSREKRRERGFLRVLRHKARGGSGPPLLPPKDELEDIADKAEDEESLHLLEARLGRMDRLICELGEKLHNAITNGRSFVEPRLVPGYSGGRPDEVSSLEAQLVLLRGTVKEHEDKINYLEHSLGTPRTAATRGLPLGSRLRLLESLVAHLEEEAREQTPPAPPLGDLDADLLCRGIHETVREALDMKFEDFASLTDRRRDEIDELHLRIDRRRDEIDDLQKLSDSSKANYSGRVSGLERRAEEATALHERLVDFQEVIAGRLDGLEKLHEDWGRWQDYRERLASSMLKGKAKGKGKIDRDGAPASTPGPSAGRWRAGGSAA